MTHPYKKEAMRSHDKKLKSYADGGEVLSGPGESEIRDPEELERRSLGMENLNQDLAERDAAMMKIQDPKLSQIVQDRRKNEEIHELDKTKQFDI